MESQPQNPEFRNNPENFTHEIAMLVFSMIIKVSKGAKIRNQYNQVPHLTQDTNKPTKLDQILLTLCMLGNVSCFCCPLLTFFTIHFFQKILSGTLSECQKVMIQIKTVILSVLI